jgi:xanthine dehydrogenase YagR molybdenum-binding subunit
MSIVEKAKQAAQGAAQAVLQKAVQTAPDSWMPGGRPDPLILQQHGHVGRPISRLDGPLKVQGGVPFAAEYPMEGMLYAAILFSPITKGRVTALDTAEAEAAPGVIEVMTHRNAPRMAPMPLFLTSNKAFGGNDLPVMQDDRIYWNGEPVAVVLAETQEQADHAISLIHATYQADPAVTVYADAKAKGTAPGMFMGQPLRREIGDAEKALTAAPHRVDHVYTTPRHSHNAIELHAVTAVWEGDRLRVHDASQAVAHAAWSLAQMFGIDEEQVHVSSPFVGGGFGGKALWPHQVLAAAAAKLTGRPVRLMLSREGVYRIVGGRTITEQRVAIGAQADGAFDALIHTGTVVMSHHNVLPEPFILPTMSSYAAGSFELDVEVAYVDMVANTFMRAPGEAVGSWALARGGGGGGVVRR